MIYKIGVSYGGENSFTGELEFFVESEEYTQYVKLSLILLIPRLLDLPDFKWWVVDGNGNLMEDYND